MRLFLEFLSLSRHHPLAPSVLRNFKNFIFVTQSWCTLCPQDIPLTLRSMDRKPIRTKMQVRHQKPFKCLYYLIIWWSSGDHLVIIWWFGDHLIICSSSGNLVIIKSSFSMGLIVWLYATPFAASTDEGVTYNYFQLLLFGDHLVIIWWSSGDHWLYATACSASAEPVEEKSSDRATKISFSAAGGLSLPLSSSSSSSTSSSCHHHNHYQDLAAPAPTGRRSCGRRGGKI